MTLAWPTIERFLVEHDAALRGTLAAGLRPREVGPCMVVRPDGRCSVIGWAALEWLTLAQAQQTIAADDGATLRRLDAAGEPDLGQWCEAVVTPEPLRRGDLDKVSGGAAHA
jgi:xanthine/CO dehydrogenase XdhC/CoxF family maturation factor